MSQVAKNGRSVPPEVAKAIIYQIKAYHEYNPKIYDSKSVLAA